MFLESGGAPPAFFLDTTPQPFIEFQTTPIYEVFDTTAPTEFPLFDVFPTEGTNPRDFLEQIGLRLITFGRAFEKAAFSRDMPVSTSAPLTEASTIPQTHEPATSSLTHSNLNAGLNADQINPHQNHEGKTGLIVIPVDLIQNQEPQTGIFSIPGLDSRNLLGNTSSDECADARFFPFCGPDGCSNFGVTIYVAFQILLLVLIVASNITIISVINDMNKHSRNRVSKSNNVFKLSLAIADLLLGLSILPGGIQQSVSALIDIESFNVNKIFALNHSTNNSLPAILFGGGAVISTIVGIWSILMMKVDLFLRIKFPLRQHSGSMMNTTRARICVIIIWLMAIGLVASLFPIGFSFSLSPISLTYAPTLRPDLVSDAVHKNLMEGVKLKVLLYALCVWGLPFLITLPLGAYLFHTIAAARRKLHMRSQASYIKRHADHTERKIRNRRDWEAACRIMTVEVVYVLTFMPIIISHIVLAVYGACNRHAIMMNFASLFILVVGSFVNLFVYHMMWKDFQIKLRSLFCGRQVTRENTRTQISTIQHTSGTLDNHNAAHITVTFEIPST